LVSGPSPKKLNIRDSSASKPVTLDVMLKAVRVGAVQAHVPRSKDDGETQVIRFVEQATLSGAELIGLPEDCLAPSRDMKAGYDPFIFLSALAKKHKVYLFGATIRQESAGLCNVGFMFDPKGALLARHNKIALTPLEVEGGIVPGNNLTVFDTEFGKMALLVCKDAFHRYAAWFFEELRKANVDVVLVPSYSLSVTERSVNLWIDSIKALSNWFDTFIVAPGTIGPNTTDFPSFGHALIVSPLQGVLAEGSVDKEELLTATLKAESLTKIRNTYGSTWQPKRPFDVKVS
jgi:omega-amidase